MPQKQPKRGRLWLADGSCVRRRPEYRHQRVVAERTQDGRPLKILTVVEEYSRECLARWPDDYGRPMSSRRWRSSVCARRPGAYPFRVHEPGSRRRWVVQSRDRYGLRLGGAGPSRSGAHTRGAEGAGGSTSSCLRREELRTTAGHGLLSGWSRARRGPPPRQSDAQLLAAIRTDLARSPFHGEGHRKVHARLRILDGIRVARTRVLRVMRAHGLLSPHRGRQGPAKTHDGRVITQAPNVMWGTDGVRVFTLDDGWGWIFAAVEHWNAECVGWHVCKVGSRFAALDPIAQGLDRRYGSLDADVARGLALRMDHGSQYLSDHFLKQIRYWGIHPSFGFVEEPETNGVAERWNRTLKEQAIHGRIFQNLEAVRAAVADFVERYNQTWRLEKLGYHTPIEAREEYELRQAA